MEFTVRLDPWTCGAGTKCRRWGQRGARGRPESRADWFASGGNGLSAVTRHFPFRDKHSSLAHNILQRSSVRCVQFLLLGLSGRPVERCRATQPQPGPQPRGEADPPAVVLDLVRDEGRAVRRRHEAAALHAGREGEHKMARHTRGQRAWGPNHSISLNRRHAVACRVCEGSHCTAQCQLMCCAVCG